MKEHFYLRTDIPRRCLYPAPLLRVQSTGKQGLDSW